MDRRQIENLLDENDVLSSLLSEFDNTDENPDGQSDNDGNENNNVVDYESDVNNDASSKWNDLL